MLSIIIPTLNESNWILDKMIESIKLCSPQDIEIIVVDDCSEIEPNFKYKKDVIFHRNTIRMGAAQSKHIGVCLSSNKYIFLTDSHVLFDDLYYDNVVNSIHDNPNTLYCGVCLGLSHNNFDMKKYNGAYYGARLFLYDEKDNEILDGKWVKKEKEEIYDISCVMGANYFMNKDWFFKIRGYGDLKAWGSEEPCLSMKTWLAGGNVRINTKVKTGHLFRDKAPYTTQVRDILYNKIRLAKTILPVELCDKLLSKINNKTNFEIAMKLFDSHKNICDEYNKYYNSMFTRDIYWLCEKFSIKIPDAKYEYK